MSAAIQPEAVERMTLADLQDCTVWVAWQVEKRAPGDTKPTKIPYDPATGRRAKANDHTTWNTRPEAENRAAQLAKPFQLGGVGIEFCDMAYGQNTGGVDLDQCRDPTTGIIEPWAVDIIAMLQSYAEVSPSQTGVKVFFRYDTADAMALRSLLGKNASGEPKFSALWKRPDAQNTGHAPGIELHLGNRFFTVTDAILPDSTNELRVVPTADLVRLITLTAPAYASGGTATVTDIVTDGASGGKAKAATGGKAGADRSRSAAAYRVGAAARRAGKAYEQFCDALRTDADTAGWYAEKGAPNGERELRRIWEKTDPATQTELILFPGAPMVSARTYMARQHIEDDLPTLHHQCGAFYAWRGSHYAERAGEDIRARLWTFLDGAKKLDDEDKPVPFNPNRNSVGNAQEALAAVCQLPTDLQAPAWLNGHEGPPAAELIACANGLLHLPTMQLLAATPAFFTTNALTFAYEAAAPQPATWLAFLKTIWPNDQPSIDTLQELFGLLLTADTRYQKAFLIVGPKRSGKGTIARVLTELIGAANVCGPTLSSLTGTFGLQPLIGKRLALISDARLSGKADQSIITERLLSVTGEDGQSVDRKCQTAWFGRLAARFVVLTNELPRLTDASGALAGRFIMLRMTQSFFGKEDLGLLAKLLPELPGVLLWAIDGWRRLTDRGHFVTPASAADAQAELENLGSPIGAFIREYCEVGQGVSVQAATLYRLWCIWCTEQGRDHPGTVQTFGRDLGAAVPGLRVEQHRHDDGSRPRYYEGITVTAAAVDKLMPARDGTRTTPLQDELRGHPAWEDDDGR